MDSVKRKSMIQIMRRNSNPQITEQNDNIGKYKILKKLGQGSYGSVYKFITDDDKVFAVKTMVRDLWNDSIQETYQKEVDNNRLMKGQKASNYVVQMIENYDNILVNYQGKVQSCHVIVMEYIEKGSIEDLITKKKQGLSPITTKTLFYEMLQNLKYIHERGYAHLDIKLDNMVISDNFNLKLIDLSFMTYFKDNKLYKKFQGTRPYMSYEINTFEPYNPEKADIFALDVCLFRLLTGCFPFFKAGISDNDYQHIFNENYNQFWENQRQKIGQLVIKQIPQNVKQLINNMIQKDPDSRPDISQILDNSWFQTDLNIAIMKQDLYLQKHKSFSVYQQYLNEEKIPVLLKKFTDNLQFD